VFAAAAALTTAFAARSVRVPGQSAEQRFRDTGVVDATPVIGRFSRAYPLR